MLRAFRARDIPAYGELYRRYFREESEFTLTRAEGMERVIARAYRWDARFLLGLLRLVGYPIGRFLAVEVDGRLAGVTFVFFDPPSAHIVSVVVDAPFRRRGFAKLLVGAAEAAGRRRGCRYALLEVLEDNAPAIALYRSTGYLPVRGVGWFAREVGPSETPLPEPPTGERARPIRRMERRDAAPLARVALDQQPALERGIRTIRPGNFRVAPPIIQILGGESEAFVREGPEGLDGFVRASTSGAMDSGHLTAPVFAPGVADPEALDLIDQGLAWFREHPVRRIICEAPDDATRLIARLAARGFRRGLGVHVLAKPLAPPS